jgi:rare lipoprotein A (peptidoglycan hydrolase)
MTWSPLEQLFALAAIALLAATVAYAATGGGGGPSRSPHPVGDYVALAGSAGPAAVGRKTACGGVLRPNTLGIAHPTLPCGARVFLDFHGAHVLTAVVDRGPYLPGRQFDVTDALARMLGLQGVQQVHWSYAQG